MFDRDGLFGKKDDPQHKDARTPAHGSTAPRPHAADPSRPDGVVPAPSRGSGEKGSKLIVGPDIKLKGVEITDCDTLVVEGRVEASMDSRVIQIAENGVFSGTVSIDVAEIRGTFEGELTARKHLVIYSTGRVSGEIRYGKIRIEEGGEISGQISTLETTPEVVVSPAPSVTPTQTASAPAAPALQSSSAPAAAPPSAPSGASLTRPAQPAIPGLGDQSAATAAASREPAASRAPKSFSRPNGAGVNSV